MSKSLTLFCHVPFTSSDFFGTKIKIYSPFLHLYDTDTDATPSSGVDVDEFCPQMDETNFMILKQIGDNADDSSIFSVPNNNNNTTLSNDSDSDNELLPKNAVIPEPDEIDAGDESVDFLMDTNNLVLTQSAEYKRKHFSNTSSESDSDDSITKGLNFKNIPVTATIEPHSSPSSSQHSLLSNIQQTLARNLIENMTRTLVEPKSSSQVKNFNDSEEDSDFEILDSEDIPK